MRKQAQKTGALIIVFLLSIQLVSAQKADTSISRPSSPMYDRYMQRQKKFNKAGSVLLTSGVILALIGLIDISSADAHSRCDDCLVSNFDAGRLLIGAGGILALTSIPFFVIHRSNARRAGRASLQLKSGAMQGPGQFSYVALAFKINL